MVNPFNLVFIRNRSLYADIKAHLQKLTPHCFNCQFFPAISAVSSRIGNTPRPDGIIIPLGNLNPHGRRRQQDPLSNVDFGAIETSIIDLMQIANPRGLIAYVIHQLSPVPRSFLKHLDANHPALKRPRLSHRTIAANQPNWTQDGAKTIIQHLCGATIKEGIEFLIEGHGSYLCHLGNSPDCCLTGCIAACERLQALQNLIAVSWPCLDPVTQNAIAKHYRVNQSGKKYKVTRLPE